MAFWGGWGEPVKPRYVPHAPLPETEKRWYVILCGALYLYYGSQQ